MEPASSLRTTGATSRSPEGREHRRDYEDYGQGESAPYANRHQDHLRSETVAIVAQDVTKKTLFLPPGV